MSPAFRRTLVALLWLALAAFTALGLGDAIGDGDESVHAEMLREMLRSGDYLHTRWYGVALAERPQLVYWLAAPFAALISGELGVRASSALASLLTLLVVYRTALREWGRPSAAAIAALLLAGAPSYHDFSRRLMSEGPFVLGLTLALSGTIRAQRERAGFWMLAAGLGLATAVKSLAVAVPALALAPWIAVAARAHGDRRTLLGALGLFLLLALPFYVIGFALDPGQFWREHVLFHLLQRAQGGFVGIGGGVLAYAHWLPRSDGPLVVGWLALGTLAACSLGRRDRALAIAGSYALLVFAGMSLLGTRLPHYVLPIYPAAALGFAGSWAALLQRSPQLRTSQGATLGLILAIGCAVISRRYPGGHEYLFERPYGKLLGERARPLVAADAKLYAFEWYGLSLGYYADRKVVLLTGHKDRFVSIDFARGAIHRAGVAMLVPPLPEPPGAQIVIAGHVQDLSQAGWMKVGEVLAAAPPYFLVSAEILPPLASR